MLALILPLIIIFGIWGGIFTPTEAGAAATANLFG
nr:TRAP transporter large permease subunit [Bacillus sp. FJAT-29937]